MKRVILIATSLALFLFASILTVQTILEINQPNATENVAFAAVHECDGGSQWFSNWDNAGYTGCMLNGEMQFQIKICTVYGPGLGCMADSCNPPCTIDDPV